MCTTATIALHSKNAFYKDKTPTISQKPSKLQEGLLYLLL